MSATDVMIDSCRVIQGDALQVLPMLPEASIQLLCVDPPYFRAKLQYNGERIDWDRQWKTREAYLDWLRQLAKEWQRVLAPNGSLYCFASPQMAAWVEVTLSESFNVLTRIQWLKANGWHNKTVPEELTTYLSPREEIVFAEQYGSDTTALGESGYQAAERSLKTSLFSTPIARAMQGTRTTAKEVTEAIGAYGTVNHGGAVSNWLQGYNIPTKPQYEAMRQFFNSRNCHHDYLCREYEDLRREYEDLRREYEDLRREYEDLRRPFTVSAAVPFTDVWEFPTVAPFPGKHPCEKPLPLLRHLITVSSRPGDTVLDCFAGRGSTLEAARQCGRQAIGIEQDAKWYQAMVQRLSQRDLFTVTETQRQALASQQEALWPR